MYRFIRTVTANTGASVPLALQWARDVTAYINKSYALNLKFGMELFGPAKIQWHFDSDSLDKISAVNAKMMQDREYAGMLEKAKGFWLEGSLKDTIIAVLGYSGRVAGRPPAPALISRLTICRTVRALT